MFFKNDHPVVRYMKRRNLYRAISKVIGAIIVTFLFFYFAHR